MSCVEIRLARIPRKWINANHRGSWMVRHRLTRQWRDATAWHCRKVTETFPDGARVVALLILHGNYRRDPANWAPTAKAVIDGMVDAGIFPDDNAKYIDGPDMRLGPPAASKADEAIVIQIWPKEPA